MSLSLDRIALSELCKYTVSSLDDGNCLCAQYLIIRTSIAVANDDQETPPHNFVNIVEEMKPTV